jgi:hypothetical protein
MIRSLMGSMQEQMGNTSRELKALRNNENDTLGKKKHCDRN